MDLREFKGLVFQVELPAWDLARRFAELLVENIRCEFSDAFPYDSPN